MKKNIDDCLKVRLSFLRQVTEILDHEGIRMLPCLTEADWDDVMCNEEEISNSYETDEFKLHVKLRRNSVIIEEEKRINDMMLYNEEEIQVFDWRSESLLFEVFLLCSKIIEKNALHVNKTSHAKYI